MFRVFVSGRVSDVAAFRKLHKRISVYMKQHEPGTSVYNWFVSDDGLYVNEDGYADDDAFLSHIGNAQEQGFYDEVLGLTEVDSISVLGDAGESVLHALRDFSPRNYRIVGSL